MKHDKEDCPYCRRDAGYREVVETVNAGGYSASVIDTPDGMKAHVPFVGYCWIDPLSKYGLWAENYQRPDSFEVDE